MRMSVKANTRNRMPTRGRRRIMAADGDAGNASSSVNVAPEASELVFESQDVAQLIAEVTGQDVEVAADESEVTFTVGDTDYTVHAEGDEEVLEAATSLRSRRPVDASRRLNRRRPVGASSSMPYRRSGRTLRRMGR